MLSLVEKGSADGYVQPTTLENGSKRLAGLGVDCTIPFLVSIYSFYLQRSSLYTPIAFSGSVAHRCVAH